MDKAPSISGIDPKDLINNAGLLRSLFDISDNAMMLIEPVLNSSGSLEALPIKSGNNAAQQLFHDSLPFTSDFLKFNVRFHRLDFWENCLNTLQTNDVYEDVLYYLAGDDERTFQIVVMKVSGSQLLIFLKNIKQSDNSLVVNHQETLLKETERLLNFGSWEYDKEKELVHWSKGMYDIFNLPEDSPISVDKYLDYAMQENRSLVEDFVTRLRTDDSTIEEDLPLQIGGEIKLIHVKSSPIRDEFGRVRKVIGVDVDITENHAVKKELSTQQYFIDQILQASPVLINIYDLTKEVFVYFSKEVSSFIGYTSDAILAMQPSELHSLIDDDDSERVLSFFNGFKTVKDDEIRTIEYRLKAIDNSCRWLKVRAKVFMRNDVGQACQIICAVQDHTLTKEAESKLREHEMMELLLERKDEFINVASHELKTPITTVKASLQILQRMMERHESDSLVTLFLQKALVQTNKLAILTKDLIDNAKMQSGKMRLNYETFDLNSFFSEAVEEQMEGFEMVVQNSVQRQIRADRRRLEQVLKNFLSNAAKYSPLADKIIIKAEETPDSIKISVQDFGIGIPTDKVSNVFDRYYRVDERNMQFSGLGLGLHISAEIIKMHGGEYGVESRIGEGSTFWFSIPDTPSH